jgi:phenylacetate-CoA ligase
MYTGIYANTKRFFLPGERLTRQFSRELKRSQWLSQPELEALQLAKLQQLVEFAYEHVPFYRERYQREGIHPHDIKSFDDFRALPLLTREDVQNHLDELVAPTFEGKLHQSRTGGSTGQPIRFYYEGSFSKWDTALRRRGRGWYGVRDGDKEAWVWGAERDMVHWSWKRRLQARFQRRRYLNAFDMSEAKMQAFAEMLVHWQPALIRAYSSALSLFARYVKEQGIVSIRPRLVEITAEKVTAPQRRLFESVFRCPVVDYYSTREMAAIVYPCAEGGLHVCETRYLELVVNDRPVEPGNAGEVVLTSLHQYAMPFIRYKIGDLAVYAEDGCSCKRGMPVLREITGRENDFLVTSDDRIVGPGFVCTTLWARPEVGRYQVYQPDRQHLEVRVECRQDVDEAWIEGIRNDFRAQLGESTQVSVQVLDRIELTPAGKLRFVISDVAREFKV